MVDYAVTIEKDGLVVRGDFPPHLKPISIPNDYNLKKRYVGLFLHKRDIELGMRYLQCISFEKHEVINEGLFVSGLNAFIKCFLKNAAREKILSSIFKDEETRNLYNYFKSLRNKHFMHDGKSMTQTTAFLLVDFEKELPQIYNASVAWNLDPLDYLLNANKLLYLMQITRSYLCDEIDAMNKKIVQDFSRKTKDDLMRNGSPQIKLASTKNVNQNRMNT